MNNEEIKPLLVKHITGEADEIECIQVKQWMSAHPENEQYYIELYEAWQKMLHLRTDVTDHEKAFKRLMEKVDPSVIPMRRQSGNWYKFAAAIVLFITAGWAVTRHYYHRNVVEVRQIVVNRGDVKKVVLSDGTQVWLNAASTLKYGSDFGKTTRTVYLDGEALFDIAPGHKNVPFIVQTKNYIIRDIGTRFNLKSYTGDPAFETTVIRGEVSVESNPVNDGNTEMNRIFLKRNQMLRILNRTQDLEGGLTKPVADAKVLNDIQIQEVEASRLNQFEGWKDNELVFEDKTLAEINSVLERHYDVKIRMDDAQLQNIRYTGSFRNIASIDKVLDIIQENTPIKHRIKNKEVIITKTK